MEWPSLLFHCILAYTWWREHEENNGPLSKGHAPPNWTSRHPLNSTPKCLSIVIYGISFWQVLVCLGSPQNEILSPWHRTLSLFLSPFLCYCILPLVRLLFLTPLPKSLPPPPCSDPGKSLSPFPSTLSLTMDLSFRIRLSDSSPDFSNLFSSQTHRFH